MRFVVNRHLPRRFMSRTNLQWPFTMLFCIVPLFRTMENSDESERCFEVSVRDSVMSRVGELGKFGNDSDM